MPTIYSETYPQIKKLFDHRLGEDKYDFEIIAKTFAEYYPDVISLPVLEKAISDQSEDCSAYLTWFEKDVIPHMADQYDAESVIRMTSNLLNEIDCPLRKRPIPIGAFGSDFQLGVKE